MAEVITAYLLTGEVRNAVNLPYLDAKTYEQIKPYLTLGEKLGKLLAQLAPPQVDRLHITYGGKAQELPNIDPVTRAIVLGFLSRAAVKDLNNINVRSIASTLGLTVEEKRSNEPVTFNEWLHVQVFNGTEKVISAGGTFFGSPNNPRIVRVFSTPVEIPISGTVLLLNNKDRPGMVGYLGTLLGKHNVNIASMSLQPRRRRRRCLHGAQPRQRAARAGAGRTAARSRHQQRQSRHIVNHPTPKKIMTHKTAKIPSLALIAALIAAPGAFAVNSGTNAAAKPADKLTELFGDPVIAKGKGVEVKRSQLDSAMNITKAAAAGRGQMPSPEQMQLLEQQALQGLIHFQLLLNQATAADKAKGREVFQKNIEKIKARGKLSEEEFNERLNRQMKIEGQTKEQWEQLGIEQGPPRSSSNANSKSP